MKEATSTLGNVAAKAVRCLALTAVAVGVAVWVAIATRPELKRSPVLERPPAWVDEIPFPDLSPAVYRWKDKYGQENGPTIVRWPTGGLKVVGFYRNGVKHGWWATFNANQDVVCVYEYDNGEIIGTWQGGNTSGRID